MVRIIGFLVGLGFVGALLFSLITGLIEYLGNPPAESAEEMFHLEAQSVGLASDGPFGHYDLQQLQRGFQVYEEVCSVCHSLKYVAFRDLTEIGFSGPEVDAIADRWRIPVPDVDPQTGEATTRKAVAADHFPLAFANDVVARAANNNAVPPDLSLMAKAREGGPSYIHSLITGYRNPQTYRNAEGEALPQESRPPTGLYFNPYFPNLNLAMPPPLTADGQVTYADGTRATINQMAYDVSAFLVWAAEPKLPNRHAAGLAVIVFLLFVTGLAWLAYQNVWRDQKH